MADVHGTLPPAPLLILAAVAGCAGPWPSSHARMLSYAPDDARGEALRTVDRRLDEILAPLIAGEATKLETLSRGLLAVQRGNRWYREYASRYGFARERPAYRQPVDVLMGMRDRHLAESRHAVVEFMDRLGQESEVDQVVATLLAVPGDRSTSGGQAITELLVEIADAYRTGH